MPKANNSRDLVLEIRLFKPKRIVPPNEFVNKSKDKRSYHGLIQ